MMPDDICAIESFLKSSRSLLQSDTFADGENPQLPAPHIGEVLSRQGSPSGDVDPQHEGGEERSFSPPVADSPRDSRGDDEEHFDVEALDEEMISPEQDREALAEMYHVSRTWAEQVS